MGKNYSGSKLSDMSDKEIEQILAGKRVKIYAASDKASFEQGEIVNFFHCATSDLPDHQIAGIVLRCNKYISFTDNIKIEIEDE